MSNEEKNEKIAEILGFEKIPAKPENGIDFEQWRFPEEWKDEIKCSPVMYIPDFIKLMNQARDIDKMFNYGIPSQQLYSQKGYFTIKNKI